MLCKCDTACTLTRGTDTTSDGRMTVDVPRSRAGDYIELRAEMDLWCALTACSAEGSNNGTLKPIDYIIT